MSAKVTLTVTQGSLEGRQFIFEDRTTCLIGRSSDCQLKLPNDELHRTISRYHCLLDINPPDIRVRDFGSKNGTYINEKKIGQRRLNQTAQEAAKMTFQEHDLKEGDEIKIGKTVFKISIQGTREGEKSDFTNFSNQNSNTGATLVEGQSFSPVRTASPAHPCRRPARPSRSVSSVLPPPLRALVSSFASPPPLAREVKEGG